MSSEDLGELPTEAVAGDPTIELPKEDEVKAEEPKEKGNGLSEAVERVENLFKEYTTVELSELEAEVFGRIRSKISDLHGDILSTPKGRYQSLALTALETVATWVGKAIAHKL